MWKSVWCIHREFSYESMVKEFWKSVYTCQSYWQTSSGLLMNTNSKPYPPRISSVPFSIIYRDLWPSTWDPLLEPLAICETNWSKRFKFGMQPDVAMFWGTVKHLAAREAYLGVHTARLLWSESYFAVLLRYNTLSCSERQYSHCI